MAQEIKNGFIRHFVGSVIVLSVFSAAGFYYGFQYNYTRAKPKLEAYKNKIDSLDKAIVKHQLVIERNNGHIKLLRQKIHILDAKNDTLLMENQIIKRIANENNIKFRTMPSDSLILFFTNHLSKGTDRQR